MTFRGFSASDFDTFLIPGLEPRMEALKAGPRPKLEAIGQALTPHLKRMTGLDFYPHIAKHARRKVNPPSDTWVSLSTNKRGYKMAPHFQVGLWSTHVFIQAGVIYEAHGRKEFAQNILDSLDFLKAEIPGHFRWLEDYTNPEGIRHDRMTDEDVRRITDRLTNRKEADAMVGLSIDRSEVIAMGPAIWDLIVGTCQTLVPVYMMADNAYVSARE